MPLHLTTGALPCQCSVVDGLVPAVAFTSNQCDHEMCLRSICTAVFLAEVTPPCFGYALAPVREMHETTFKTPICIVTYAPYSAHRFNRISAFSSFLSLHVPLYHTFVEDSLFDGTCELKTWTSKKAVGPENSALLCQVLLLS